MKNLDWIIKYPLHGIHVTRFLHFLCVECGSGTHTSMCDARMRSETTVIHSTPCHRKLYQEHWLIIIIYALILFLGIDWGLPSSKRTNLLISGTRPTAHEIQLMNSLRDRNAQTREAHLSIAAKRVMRGERIDIERMTASQEPGRFFSEEDRLTALRNYILGSSGVDEMYVPQSIARMDPPRMDFDPKTYVYGGAFLYPIAASYYLLKLAGMLHVTSNFDYYLLHPSNAAMLYLPGRIFNVLAFLGVLVLLGLLAVKLGGRLTATLSILTFGFSTLPLNYAIVNKPHVYSAFFIMLALYLAMLYSKHPKRGYLIGSALAAGFSVGSALPTGLVALLYPLLLFDRRRLSSSLREIAAVWVGIGIVFLLTNPYAIISYKRYALNLVIHGSSRGFGYAAFSLPKLALYCREILMRAYAFPIAILGLLNMFLACWKAQGIVRRLAIGSLIIIFIGGSIVGSSRLTLFIGPVLCLYSGMALNHWIIHFPRGPRALKVAIVAIMFIPGAFFTFLYARDTISHDAWYEPVVLWLRSARIGPQTSIGVFGTPSPIDIPPFPFLHTNLMNMNKYSGDLQPPEYVILGNYDMRNTREKWDRHPLRSRYELAFNLGCRPSYHWLLGLRTANQSRVAAVVFKRIN